jgi:hypothetical protein
MLRGCFGIQGLDLFAEKLTPRLHHLNVLLQSKASNVCNTLHNSAFVHAF